MAKTSKFVLKIGEYERHELTLTAADAARAATQIARGTFDRNKSWDEQPANARPGRAVKLLDEKGHVVMDCRPTIRPSLKAEKAGRMAQRSFAACSIAPSFKTKIRKRRRRR